MKQLVARIHAMLQRFAHPHGRQTLPGTQQRSLHDNEHIERLNAVRRSQDETAAVLESLEIQLRLQQRAASAAERRRRG